MNIIEIKDLKKYFGKTKALDGISFDVTEGEIFGFLGPNGAGKTTTIRCMMNYINPNEGSILIFGRDSAKEGVYLKKRIGYLSGYVKLYDKWTGRDHIELVKKLHNIKEWPKDLIERFDFNPDKKSKGLSSGNRQKLGIIMAFMVKPDLLIMDEPTNGLDPLLQNELYKMLQEQRAKGTTIFMSSHNLTEVERVCNRIGIIKNGKMVTIEDIASLKVKKINTVHAYFAEKVDKKDFQHENIEIINELPDTLLMKVKGDINPCIKAIAKYKLKDIDIFQASLEDIFLEHY